MLSIEQSYISIENSTFKDINFVNPGALFFLIYSDLVINNLTAEEISSKGSSFMELGQNSSAIVKNSNLSNMKA